jgi:hypothetical protein
MAMVDHWVSVKRVPACGATARLPSNKQFDGVLVGQRHRPRVRPGVAGRWLGGPKPTFDLLLYRQLDAPTEDVAEIRVRVVHGVLPFLIVEVAGTSAEAGQRPRLALPDPVTQGPAAPGLVRVQPSCSPLLSDPCDQSEMAGSLWCHLRGGGTVTRSLTEREAGAAAVSNRPLPLQLLDSLHSCPPPTSVSHASVSLPACLTT